MNYKRAPQEMTVQPHSYLTSMFVRAWAIMIAVGVLYHQEAIDFTLSYWESFIVGWGANALFPMGFVVSRLFDYGDSR